MNIDILGFGGAMFAESIGTSFLIDNRILVETPPSITNTLNKDNFDICCIDKIFISHLHGDHFWGLPFFLLELFRKDEKHYVEIYSPPGLKKLMFQLLSLIFPPKSYDYILESSYIKFKDINDFDVIDATTHILIPFKVKHTVETFGLIVKESDCQIFYSADTELFEGLHDIVKASNAVFLDASEFKKSIKGHMSYEQIKIFAETYTNVIFYPIHRSKYHVVDEKNILIPTHTQHRRIVV